MIPSWLRSPLVLVLLAAPAPALAHAILLDSFPAIGSTIAPGDVSFRLRFNSRIDHARSRLTVGTRTSQQVILPIDTGNQPDMLKSFLTLPAGDYVLRWQVLAIDGHITRGEVPFTVRAAPAKP